MLADLLPLVLHDLNEHGECTIPLDGANLLSIRLPPLLSSTAPPHHAAATPSPTLTHPPAHTPARSAAAALRVGTKYAPAEDDWLGSLQASQRLNGWQGTPPNPGEEEVPVLLCAADELMRVDCDLAVRRVIPHIDGVRCVKVIANHAGVDVQCAQRSIRVLLWHGWVVLVDLFRYANMYATHSNVSTLFADQFVARRVAAKALAFSQVSSKGEGGEGGEGG